MFWIYFHFLETSGFPPPPPPQLQKIWNFDIIPAPGELSIELGIPGLELE